MGSPTTKANGGLSFDIWHLIVQEIEERKDLCNLSLASQKLCSIAIPRLYRVIPLRLKDRPRYGWPAGQGPMDFIDSLSRTLLESKDSRRRNAVHKLSYFCPSHAGGEMERQLIALHDGLPNLKRIKIQGRLSDGGLRHITKSDKQVSLSLSEDGTRAIEDDMLNVVSLQASVDTYDEHKGPNRRILALQKFLFACPNLKSFSLSMTGGYGGCVIEIPQYEQIRGFRFTGSEIFPPLESLSINGYYFQDGEWPHWRSKLQWSKLRTVNLGPQFSARFLELATGYTQSLQHLKVEIYSNEDPRHSCLPLENFLRTFTALESLTIRGYHLSSVTPIANHPRLKHLCLHSIEPVGSTPHQRPTLSPVDLTVLDQSLPHLETLELDVQRAGEWPIDFLSTLADGFLNLFSLTLHLEIGLTHPCGPPIPVRYELKTPILNENSAHEVGRIFFNERSTPSRLRELVLKTGESLRRFPQWEPHYRRFEREQSKTIKVHRPHYL
ncbi:hypothetical protein GGR55DRAFT_689124 [Xylaria sp. FL0064]|nr:hypothetical protein GGR55DRAFT_689124 [Xylaria sp. FL0064]